MKTCLASALHIVEQQQQSKTPPIIAITFATHHNAALDDWLFTARRFGYAPRVLGVGVPWRGFFQKVEHYLTECKRIATQHPFQIVLCCDAYDILFNAPASQAQQVMQNHVLRNGGGRTIVIGMEDHCGHNCVGSVFDTSTPPPTYPYINSGCIMGYAAALVTLFEKALATAEQDDQIAIGKVCQSAACRANIGFDTQRELVANLMPRLIPKNRDHLQWQPKDKYFLVNGKRPCVLHFPGTIGDFMYRENVLRTHLIGPGRRANRRDIAKTVWNKYKKRITVGFAFVFPVIVILGYKICKRVLKQQKSEGVLSL